MDDDGDSNQAKTNPLVNGPILQVSFSTVLDRLSGKIDLLKLDCEGAEWDLFEAEECWRHVSNIRMEYHLGHLRAASQVTRKLEHFGFTISLCRPSTSFGLVWASRESR